MSHEDNLNRDLFGNVVPEPASMPEPPEDAPSAYKDESDWFDNQKASVTKFSAVKEGQQYPEGKNGQYKLFHEHVWTKGYTPQRQAEVDSNMPLVVSYGTSYAPGEARRVAVDHLARSTVPVEDLQDMRKNKFPLRFGTGLPQSVSGGFIAESGNMSKKNVGSGVNMPAKQVPDPSITEVKEIKRIRNSLKTATGHALIHEIGHAVDFEQDPDRYLREAPTPYTQPNGTPMDIHARGEGRAEGYRTAHHRATRAMRRSRAKGPIGYVADRITSLPQRLMFRADRQSTFNAQMKRGQ